ATLQVLPACASSSQTGCTFATSEVRVFLIKPVFTGQFWSTSGNPSVCVGAGGCASQVSFSWSERRARTSWLQPLSGESGEGGRAFEQAERVSQVDRLDQVVIEARLPGALPVAVLAVAGDGDDQEAVELRAAAQAARHLVAVDPRQADVEQHHVRPDP